MTSINVKLGDAFLLETPPNDQHLYIAIAKTSAEKYLFVNVITRRVKSDLIIIKQSSMAKDLYHDLVKRALKKDGWEITHDPYELRVGGVEMYVDIGAEQLIGADRGNDKIAVEVKSFINPSRISDFHLAHGQFLDYRYALEDVEPDRVLYLAVPHFVYQTFFNLAFINRVIQRSQLNLLVYDLDKESIEQWIK